MTRTANHTWQAIAVLINTSGFICSTMERVDVSLAFKQIHGHCITINDILNVRILVCGFDTELRRTVDKTSCSKLEKEAEISLECVLREHRYAVR
jgi:hypothetical protein